MSDTITFERRHLAAALAIVGKVNPWRRDDRSVAVVRIDVSAGTARLSTVDVEVQIEADAPCGPGEAVFYPAFGVLSAMVTKAKGGDVAMYATEAGTVFACGRLRSTLPGRPSDALPMRPVPEGPTAAMPSASLRAGLVAALPATGEGDVNRPYLGGVHLYDVGGQAAFAAQDGNRIHSAAQDGNRIDTAALIPHKAAALIAAILPDEGDAQIQVGPRGVFVQAGNIRVTGGLINGTFPPIADLMATPTDRELRGQADLLLSEIEVVMTVANSRDRDFRLDLGATCEASAFRVGDAGPESGVIGLSGVAFRGTPLAIGFQFPLVRDALALFGRDTVTWRMGGPHDATIISSAAHPGVEALVTPFMLAADHLRHAA
jgi:DNA polymerase III sliding clamp (beta) subunit (PCNA family)